MTEFLFSMLITKLYGKNEDIFYLPKDIEIKIEIPNGFVISLINSQYYLYSLKHFIYCTFRASNCASRNRS